MMGWHDGGSFGWVGWLLMSLLMLAFWALVVFGGMALFRNLRRVDRDRPRLGGGDAQRVLDERYARGEIDENEYVHRRDLLNSGR